MYKLLLILSFLFLFVSCGTDNSKVSNENDLTEISDQDISQNDSTKSDLTNDTTPNDNDNFSDTTEATSEETNDEDNVPQIPTITPATIFPEALIVTSEEFKGEFQKLADFHTVTGVPTEVVTLKEICEHFTCDDSNHIQDTAKAIKDYIISKQPSIKYVLLGGDIEVVPSRKVHDEFEDKFETSSRIKEDYVTDYYFADLSEWDNNHNGIYAEETYPNGKSHAVDTPDYRPEIAVSRLSVSTKEEIELYLKKAINYATKYDLSKVRTALFLSNVAVKQFGYNIDSAYYFQAKNKTDSIMPKDFKIKRLYATGLGGNEKLTVPREVEEIEKGPNIIVHLGHGSRGSLTTKFDGENDYRSSEVKKLQNTNYPIFLSCACESGEFDTYPYYFKDDPNKTTYDDSAGEYLMNAKNGGAIAFLGNTNWGLGIGGGDQLIDEFLRYTFSKQNPLIGDAIKAAHQNMPTKDLYPVPVVNMTYPVINKDSYEWTQKVVVLLGDLLLPIWTNTNLKPAPQLSLNSKISGENQEITVVFQNQVSGVLRIITANNTYKIDINSESYTFKIKDTSEILSVGFTTPDSLFFFEQKF